MKRALEAVGVTSKGDFTLIEGMALRVPARLLRVLAEDSDVVSVSTDAPVTSTGLSVAVSGKAQNSKYDLMSTLGLKSTPYSGKAIGVAVLDSGIAPLQDFGKRLTLSLDFLAGGVATPAMDPYGHGTHVAGIIGGDGRDVPSLAEKVNLISLRVLAQDGSGTTSAVISAIQWAVANRAEYGIHILNLSLGHPVYEPAATDPLVQAVEAAVREGLVVVVSAGNIGMAAGQTVPGYGGITSPANAPSAITVGAIRTQNTTARTDDLVADYSSRGPTWYDAYAKPDLVAPGHQVLSATDMASDLYRRRGHSDLEKSGRTYIYLNGTSMSAPTVSGTVALMLEAALKKFKVTPTPNMIKAMLMHSAFTMTDQNGRPYDVLTQGAGALNGAGAVTLAESIDPRKAVGTDWLVSTPVTSSKIDNQDIVWGQNIVWGDNVVWGDALYVNSTAWASNIVWGDSIAWSNSLRTPDQRHQHRLGRQHRLG